MSIKAYDPLKEDWQKVSSTLASESKVVDANGNYEGENVEECLDEINKDLTRIKKDLKYIYENGSIGDGPGGGNVMPKINVTGDTTRIVKSDEKVTIYYNFTSPNPGMGKVTLAIGDKIEERMLSMGSRDSWVVGPFESGEYTLSLSAEDKQGFVSETVVVKIISGAIDLSTTFNDSEDFNTKDPVVIPYTIKSKLPHPMTAALTFNGVTTEVEAKVGDGNKWDIGVLPSTGVHKASIKIHAGQEFDGSYTESNQLDFTLVAADSDRLLVSTTFDKETWPTGKRLQLDYRVSIISNDKFNSHLWLKGRDEDWEPHHKIRSAEVYRGIHFWDLGTDLELGKYTAKCEVTAHDNSQSAYVDIDFEIVKVDFDGVTEVRDGLVVKLDSNGKQSNDVVGRNRWDNLILDGPKVNGTLYNFNHKTNGWIVDPDMYDQTVLTMSGKTYVELDYKPLQGGVERGLTIDVLYKTTNTGNMDGKVLFCKNLNTPYQGFYIDTEKAEMFGSGGYKVSSNHQDGVWTRKTIIIDRVNKLLSEYTNAAISDGTILQKRIAELDEFAFDGNLVLGAGRDIDGNIIDNGTCSIKTIRIYDRALTHMEILQNHIADIKDLEAQKEMYELNAMDVPENAPEINPSKLPVLRLNGFGIESMGEGSKIQVQVDYTDPLDSSKRFRKDGCMLELQGTSSLSYPVKNYTLFLQEGLTPKYSPNGDWLPEERWTLKTNYMDSSNANNTGLNKFAYSVMPPYPPQTSNAKTRGNTDGFPMKVYINGKDFGTYTWNIDRYAHHNYGFIHYDAEGVVVKNPNIISYEVAQNSTGGPAAFLSDDWNRVKKEFKSRYHKGWEENAYLTEEIDEYGNKVKVLTDNQHDDLLELIRWVMNADDVEFAANVQKHFSLDHLINYYLTVFSFGMIDSFGKNMVLTTYGRDEEGNDIWYPSFYDCDTALGLANNGEVKYGPEIDLTPLDGEVNPDSDLSFNTQDSKLWRLLRKNFAAQINSRYNELRQERLSQQGAILPPIFSRENLMNYLGKEIMDLIGQRFTNQDAYIKYISPASLSSDLTQASTWMISCNGTREQYTRRWIDERFIYLDSLFEYKHYSLKKITLRTYVNGEVTLSLRTYSPQKIKIKYSSNEFVKIYCDKDQDYEVTFDMTNSTENDFVIYGADNVMFVKGMEYLQLSHASFEGADKIVEINTSRSRYIRGLEIGTNCKYLQKVICTNCVNLGDETSTLNLASSLTLRYVDISNTKIQGVEFPKDGGILDQFICNNSKLQSIILKGQEYLTDVNFAGCTDLASVVLDSCNGLKNIQLPESNVSVFTVNECRNIETINLFNSKKIDKLELNDCPNLKTLNLKNVVARNLTDLNLKYCQNLESLDISNTNSIKYVTFSDIYEKLPLKKFLCEASSIETIRYGNDTINTDHVDLSRFELNDLLFLNCKNIKKVKNLTTVTSTATNMFRGCASLQSVEGNVKVIGAMNGMFKDCPNLTILPNSLDLSEVTSISESFLSSGISTDVMIRIMGLLTEKVTNCYYAFGWCKNITGKVVSGVRYALPSNLFEKTPSVTSTNMMFRGTKIDGKLPSDLLSNLTKLSNMGWMFTEVGAIDEIPQGFLDGPGTSLIYADRLFSYSGLKKAPRADIFANTPNISSLEHAFSGCKSMIGKLENSIFHGLNNLNNVYAMFHEAFELTGEMTNELFDFMTNGKPCVLKNIGYLLRSTKVTGPIPAYKSEDNVGLFDKLVNLENIVCFFPQERKDNNGNFIAYGVTGEIPPGIFANNNGLKSVDAVFAECGGLEGSIPENILKNKTFSSAANMFRGCYNLTGEIPVNLFANNPSLTTVEGVFNGCSGLEGEIPRALFHNNPSISNVKSVFKNCIGLRGEIPDRIVDVTVEENLDDPDNPIITETIVEYGLLEKCTQLTYADSMFEGCINLVSRIPEYIFVNGQQLQSINAAFAYCPNLFGPVPENLLSNCRELRTADSLFFRCKRIGRNQSDITIEYPYAIPPNLFSSCINITSLKSAFQCWWYEDGMGNLYGEIPRDLFFKNSNLQYVDSIFYGSQVSGFLDAVTFGRNKNLKSCTNAFRHSKLEGVHPDLFKTNTLVKSALNMFAETPSLVGRPAKIWEIATLTDVRGCYAGCTNLDDYDLIPPSCKVIPPNT